MAAKKSTIYIHIGTIKTGTTSLQHFFHLNRNLLAEKHQLYYPKTPGFKNHTKLPLYAFDENVKELRIRHGLDSSEALQRFRKQFKIKFSDEIKPHLAHSKSILVSSEHLSSRAVKKSEIEQLMSLFEDFDVNFKIIVYLRRQDKMMLSTYSTWVKAGGRWKLNPNAYKNRRYNHLEMLNLWSSVIGKGNIIVKVFEKQKMKGGDLFQDFCQVLSIPSLVDLQIPENDNLNSSLDEEQIQFLTLFNKFVPVIADGKPNTLRGDIVKHLESYSSENKLDISIMEKQKIYSYFEKDNNKIAEQYLGSEMTLFDPIPDSQEETKPIRLTADKAVEIAAYLWTKQQKELTEKSWTTDLKKSLKKIFRL